MTDRVSANMKIRSRKDIVKMKKVFIVVLCMCLLTGCTVNPMVAIYNNNKMIASDTNSYNLNEVKQTLEEGHFTASVEKMEGMDTIWVFEAEE